MHNIAKMHKIIVEIDIKKVGDSVVELDQFKVTLNTYRNPLQEVRDSL